ncbi:MAG: M20/M25/M40 family metallo-hydrolase [Bacillota bacterium]|nr:M20/M25/M40 family metallo-hydrolase [Bacillota bacterium]
MAMVAGYLEQHRNGFEQELSSLLAQQCVSEGARGASECAGLMARLLAGCGFDEAEVIQTEGLPGVWGYFDTGKPQTLAVYAMLDHAFVSRPWKRAPYSPVKEVLEPYGSVMFGKGVGTKGPMLVLAWALKAMRATGVDIPVNVACILETEEFIGSTNYHHMVHAKAGKLKGCVGAVSPSAGQSGTGSVSISLGSKGCAYFELVCEGARWGKGPVTPSVHSSAQGVVHSPVWRLVEALNTLMEPGSAGLACKIPGFYDNISLPKGHDLELLRKIVDSNKGKDWRRVVPGVGGRGRVEELAFGLEGEELFTRALYYPTFNINGLRAGYIHQDSPLFSLPGRAVARLDMRFAPDQRGAELMASLRAHLDKAGYPDIEIRDMGTHDWAKAEMDDAIVQAALNTYEAYGCPVTIWPMRGAGAPLGVFCSELGVPAMGGIGIGHCGSDGTDEYMVLDGNDKVAGVSRAGQFLADYLAQLAK